MTPSNRPLHLAPWWGAAAFWLAASTGAAVRAAPITYEYGGTVTSADPSTGVAPGTRFSGAFSYDPEKPTGGIGDVADDSVTGYGNVPGLTQGSPAISGVGLSLQVGTHQVVSVQGGLVVDVNATSLPGDPGYGRAGGLVGPFTAVGVSNTYADDGLTHVSLNLTNPTRSVPSMPPSTPTQWLSLADFPTATLLVTSAAPGPSAQTLYTGTIDSLTVVPEPASAALLCLAAAGWLARSQGRRLRTAANRA